MKKENKTNSKNFLWPLKILIMAVFLSLGFSLLSELILTKATIIISILVIVVFIVLSILFDMIGLAVASANVEDFNAMAARKVVGSKQGKLLVQNADKVSSICNDVIGDVCGILSGAAGATILTKIAITSTGFVEILIPSLVASVIAGLTIFGKSIFKRVAINHANTITLNFAKFLNFFTHKG